MNLPSALETAGQQASLVAGDGCRLRWATRPSTSSSASRIIIQAKASRKAIAPVVYELRSATVQGSSAAAGNENVFDRVGVWLESNTASDNHGPMVITARTQQRNRRFDPELLIIPVGSTVEFPNSDPIFHNIFSLSPAQAFDLGYYPEGHSRSITFPRAGIVQVYCHVHPSMKGVIIVTPSPWTCKPTKNGDFRWSDVSPGKYRLMVWTRTAGLIHRRIAVPAQGTVDVTVAVPEQDAEQ